MADTSTNNQPRHRGRMRWALALGLAGIALAGCGDGGDDATADATIVSEAPPETTATTASPTTTAAPTTTTTACSPGQTRGLNEARETCVDGRFVPAPVSPTTTTTTAPQPELTREARVAVAQCLDAVGPIPDSLPAMAVISGPSEVQAVLDICDEAYLQVDVDGDRQMARLLADLNLALAFLNMRAVVGELEPDGSGAPRPAVTEYTNQVTPLLAEIEEALVDA